MPVVTVLLAIVIAPAGVGLTFRVTLGSVSMERPKATRIMSAETVVGLVVAEEDCEVRILVRMRDRTRIVERRVREEKKRDDGNRWVAKRLLYPPPGG